MKILSKSKPRTNPVDDQDKKGMNPLVDEDIVNLISKDAFCQEAIESIEPISGNDITELDIFDWILFEKSFLSEVLPKKNPTTPLDSTSDKQDFKQRGLQQNANENYTMNPLVCGSFDPISGPASLHREEKCVTNDFQMQGINEIQALMSEQRWEEFERNECSQLFAEPLELMCESGERSSAKVVNTYNENTSKNENEGSLGFVRYPVEVNQNDSESKQCEIFGLEHFSGEGLSNDIINTYNVQETQAEDESKSANKIYAFEHSTSHKWARTEPDIQAEQLKDKRLYHISDAEDAVEKSFASKSQDSDKQDEGSFWENNVEISLEDIDAGRIGTWSYQEASELNYSHLSIDNFGLAHKDDDVLEYQDKVLKDLDVSAERVEEIDLDTTFLNLEAIVELPTLSTTQSITSTSIPQPQNSTKNSSECHNCVQCPVKFISKRELTSHKRKMHPKIKTIPCKDSSCERMFSAKCNMMKHYKAVHMKLKPNKCPFEGCIKEFSERNKMNKHVESVHEKKRPFICDFQNRCGEKFSQRSDLNRHLMIVHHGIQHYECGTCERGFGRKSSLSQHLYRIHHLSKEDAQALMESPEKKVSEKGTNVTVVYTNKT